MLKDSFSLRTVMKSGSDLVKAGLRTFFENAAEDLEKTLENLKLGKFTHSRSQMKGVSQNINYTTVALLPILTALFEHITEHQFGSDLLRESPQKQHIQCQRVYLCLYIYTVSELNRPVFLCINNNITIITYLEN